MSVAYAGVVQDASALPRLPPGVVVTEGPLVQAKLRESYLLLGILYVGALSRASSGPSPQGLGKVFQLFTSFWDVRADDVRHRRRHAPPVRPSQLPPPARSCGRLLLCHRPDGGAGLDRPNGSPTITATTSMPSDVGDPHSPQFDGFGNRYVSAFPRAFLHAQGSWVFDQATTDNEYYAKDILADPIAMFFVRTRWVWYGTVGRLHPRRDRLHLRRRAHHDRLRAVLRSAPRLSPHPRPASSPARSATPTATATSRSRTPRPTSS